VSARPGFRSRYSVRCQRRCGNALIPLPLTLAPRVAEFLTFLAVGRGRIFPRSDLVYYVWGRQENEPTGGSVNTAL
jgi:hypothetical protein